MINFFDLDSCIVHERFRDIIPKCNDEYSWLEEDTENYNPSWQPINNLSHFPVHYKSWEYQTSSELNTYPFVGKCPI